MLNFALKMGSKGHFLFLEFTTKENFGISPFASTLFANRDFDQVLLLYYLQSCNSRIIQGTDRNLEKNVNIFKSEVLLFLLELLFFYRQSPGGRDVYFRMKVWVPFSQFRWRGRLLLRFQHQSISDSQPAGDIKFGAIYIGESQLCFASVEESFGIFTLTFISKKNDEKPLLKAFKFPKINRDNKILIKRNYIRGLCQSRKSQGF